MVFEVVKFGGGDLYFLIADKIHGFIQVLIAAEIDVTFFVGRKFALYYAFGGSGASWRRCLC